MSISSNAFKDLLRSANNPVQLVVLKSHQEGVLRIAVSNAGKQRPDTADEHVHRLRRALHHLANTCLVPILVQC